MFYYRNVQCVVPYAGNCQMDELRFIFFHCDVPVKRFNNNMLPAFNNFRLTCIFQI